MEKVKYKPKSGRWAGQQNFKKVKEYLEKNPTATGKEIASALSISAVTVYSHLKKLK